MKTKNNFFLNFKFLKFLLILFINYLEKGKVIISLQWEFIYDKI
jgi:hypothetical protein